MLLYKKTLTRLFFLAAALLCLTGCGYHTENEETLTSSYQSISIPYIEGDDDGMLTDALIKAVALSSHLTYKKCGKLVLEGNIVSDNVEHIGYQYDRTPVSGNRINRLIPNEGRRTVTVSITLTDASTQKVVYGPTNVTAYSDFDFVDADSLQDTSFIDGRGTRRSVLFFSLGQLDSMEGARDSAKPSLYTHLARKVIVGIENLSR